jgi:hypothetical protein
LSRDRVEHLGRHFGRGDLAAAHRLVAHGLADELALGELGIFRRIRAVALAAGDAGGHEVRAQQARADLVGDQVQVLVQRLGQAHDGGLGRVVDAHVGRREQAGHAGGVGDVAAVARVFGGGFEHHRREQAHAVDHAPQVDAQHPFPVGNGVLPHQAARAHAGVVEHEVRCAETFLHGSGQRSICAASDTSTLRASTCAPAASISAAGLVERVLLHVDQHEVHAACGADARAFEAEARTRASENGGLALEVLNHLPVSFLR